jgi:TetR/AcrR family transcriptional repressor of nem operon
MGHSQADKAASRARILAEASAQIRKHGLESLSVGALMRKAGLTHGGFYGHFASRSDLLAQALERALVDGEGGARTAAQREVRPVGVAGFVRSYLSRTHRDAPETGCAIAALVGDAGRAEPAARAVMAAHIEGMIAGVGRNLAETAAANEADAIAAVCTMVGALAISRTIADPKRSDAILRAARDHLIAMAEASVRAH